MTNFLFQNLINYPDMCIYGLVNEIDKKIYLGYTSNLPLALSRIIKDSKYSNNKLNKDFKKLELIIVEKITDRKNLRLRCKSWVNEYSNNGWMLYKKETKLPTYKLRIDVYRDEARWTDEDLLVYVRLITRGYKELTVGVFSDYEEATIWSKENYPSNSINSIVYAKNALTQEFLDQWKR